MTARAGLSLVTSCELQVGGPEGITTTASRIDLGAFSTRGVQTCICVFFVRFWVVYIGFGRVKNTKLLCAMPQRGV